MLNRMTCQTTDNSWRGERIKIGNNWCFKQSAFFRFLRPWLWAFGFRFSTKFQSGIWKLSQRRIIYRPQFGFYQQWFVLKLIRDVTKDVGTNSFSHGLNYIRVISSIYIWSSWWIHMQRLGARGVGRFEKQYPTASQAKKLKYNAWPALTKKNHVCMVHPKKILTNHLQSIPTSSKSESFIYKLCQLYSVKQGCLKNWEVHWVYRVF